MESLLKEIDLRHDFFSDELSATGKPTLDSIYFGGGTPSVLEEEQLMAIFNRLSNYFIFDNTTEITLEANPDDLDLKKLSMLSQTPVNRLSIGIQSFNDADLRYMNRIHSAEQALQSVLNARKLGFRSINLDLIFGTPTLSDEAWLENLRKFSELEIPHLSAYALTLEKRTPLEVFISNGKAEPVEQEQSARQFEILLSFMAEQGFENYEISNFCIPGGFSRHNLSYWTAKPYLGLGPSAHSFRERTRWWNISNTSEYIQSLTNGVLPLDSELLSEKQLYDEYLMTSLRTMWGCNLDVVEQSWGILKKNELIRQSEKYLSNDLMAREGASLVLTDKGKLFADGIASDLFWI